MSSYLTRRRALRTVAALSASSLFTGCIGGSRGEDNPTDTASGNEISPDSIPGVESGEVVDSHTLSVAHQDELAKRSGTLVWSRTQLDRETSETVRSEVLQTSVEGDTVHAAAAGNYLWTSPDSDRREIYIEGTNRYLRDRADGEWSSREVDTDSSSPQTSDLVGRNVIGTTVGTSEYVGHESIDGSLRHRFTNGGNVKEGEGQFHLSILIDDAGLIHNWSQALDFTQDNDRLRETSQWMVKAIGNTSVERPSWVEEIRSSQ